MADQSDVESALVTIMADVLYPNGASAAGVLSETVKLYRGWPNTATLRTDLAANILNMTVFPMERGTKNTTRWPAEVVSTSGGTPTLSVNVAGSTATFSGTADAGQLAGLLVDGLAVVHRTVSGDTAELVAATLAEWLRTTRIALVDGSSVTVPGAGFMVGRVVADHTVVVSTRSQEQKFRISCWCPDATSRDTLAKAIDGALASQTFISLSDGTSGRLRYVGTTVFDQSQDAALYRRDLVYSVEYQTTVTETLPSMLFGDTALAPVGESVVDSLLN
ncbi:MAG: hypothetical protein P4K98_06270 [Bryobacteraceae bacterium]|nr:hypothetical protein [Bryobacteraceae bacterium]